MKNYDIVFSNPQDNNGLAENCACLLHISHGFGEYRSFTEWLQGLPSCFNIDFENYKILKLAVLWGSIHEKHTERQADKILENWFNFIMVKTFQLFKKYKIERSV